MVAPISGPYTKTITVKGPPTSLGFKPDWLQIRRTWYRQRRPYNLPLQYGLDSRRITSYYDTDSTSYMGVANVWYGMPQDLIDNAFNKARSKFVDLLADQADMATNLAEHRQASQMITKRLVQLASAARDVRRFRFASAAKTLGLELSRLRHFNLRKEAKSFGNNWLEFHFGWSPAVGDISTSMDILTSGLPPFKAKASAKLRRIVNELVDSSATHLYYRNSTYKCGATIGAEIEVSNPNLWLANRLGLLNPAGLAWELVPFSFVADWFVNLNDVLKSSSEFYGLNLIRPWNTRLNQLDHGEQQTWWDSQKNRARYLSWTSEFVSVSRYLSIPGATLRVRPLKALSWQRGLTAASLLVQTLKA